VLRVPWFEWNEQWAADEKCDYLATVLYSGAGLTVKDAAVVPGAASATSRVEASTRSFDRSRRGNAPIDDPAEGATRDANADANTSDGRRSSPSASSSSSSSSIFDDDFARSSDEDANSDYYSSSSSSDYSSSLGLGGVASFVARARAESDVSVHFSGSGGLVVEDVGSDEEELKLRNARKGDRLREREGGKLAYEGAWVGGDGAAQTPEAGGGDEEKTTRNQANAEAARHSTRSFDPKLRKTDVAPYGMSMEPGGGRAVTRRRVGGSAAGEERRRARGRGGVSRRGERVSEKGEYGDDAADAFDAAPEAPPKVSKVGPKVSKASTTRASARVVRGGQSGASVGRASPVRRRRVRVSAPGAASRALGRASPARETGPGVASDAGGTRSDPKDLRKRSDARSDGRPPETRFSSDARGDDEPSAALASSSSSASSSPVSSLRGVGPVSAAALGEAGVRTVGELAGLSDADVAEIANSRKKKEGGDDEKKKGSAPLRRERLAGLRNLAADVVRASEDDE
jgi:predicted flap endonuclease-1-like 5' DNA nuclease